MVDSYRSNTWHPVRDTAGQPRWYDRRHREQSSPQPGYHSRSPSARPWYEGSYDRPSPEQRPQEQRTTVTVTTITTTSTSTLATQSFHTTDESSYLPRRTTPFGREDEGNRSRSPIYNGSRREGPRRCWSRSRSPLKARETHRRREGTSRRSRSRSPGKSRDSGPATGSQDQASLADSPTCRVKTKWISRSRRAGLRSGELLPQDEQERQWVKWQRRAQDLDAGRAEPVNAIEANIVRQHRIAAMMKRKQDNNSIDERSQATAPEEPVTDYLGR